MLNDEWLAPFNELYVVVETHSVPHRGTDGKNYSHHQICIHTECGNGYKFCILVLGAGSHHAFATLGYTVA